MFVGIVGGLFCLYFGRGCWVNVFMFGGSVGVYGGKSSRCLSYFCSFKAGVGGGGRAGVALGDFKYNKTIIWTEFFGVGVEEVGVV